MVDEQLETITETPEQKLEIFKKAMKKAGIKKVSVEQAAKEAGLEKELPNKYSSLPRKTNFEVFGSKKAMVEKNCERLEGWLRSPFLIDSFRDGHERITWIKKCKINLMTPFSQKTTHQKTSSVLMKSMG